MSDQASYHILIMFSNRPGIYLQVVGKENGQKVFGGLWEAARSGEKAFRYEDTIINLNDFDRAYFRAGYGSDLTPTKTLDAAPPAGAHPHDAAG